MYFYTVLTKGENLQDTALTLNLSQKFNKLLIVKEFGVSGDNVHYNIVYEVPDDKQVNHAKNASKYFKKYYSPEFLKTLPTLDFLTKTKKCPSYWNVIGGYLQKEQNYEIVHNTGFDIDHCKTLATTNEYLNDIEVKTLYDFVEYKMMPYRDNTVYEDAYDFCNRVAIELIRLRDPDFLRFSRQKNVILLIVQAHLGQEGDFWMRRN